ncbi:MAG: hypothetical protein MMC23_007083 [Stictis urceolatum]|nr:hypothetical protein [Stictis urceolata]
MDSLSTLPRAIGPSLAPVDALYTPLITANSAAILSTRKTTHKYGPNPRHQIDLYHPPSTPSSAPILLYVHGGGLVRGGRSILDRYPSGLVHANAGHFFANKGFLTAVMDYRLVTLGGSRQGAVFPSGGEDVEMAVRWLAGEYGVEGGRSLLTLGNSAGGMHCATFLLMDKFAGMREGLRAAAGGDGKGNGLGLVWKGAALVGTPFSFGLAEASRAEVLKTYLGEGEDVKRKCPLGLLESADKAEVARGPKVLQAWCEFDPDEILVPQKEWRAEWERKGLAWEGFEIGGHNHLSLVSALGTGVEREEKWGKQVAEWMKYLDK